MGGRWVVLLGAGGFVVAVAIVALAPEHTGAGGVSIRLLLAVDLALAVAAAVPRIPEEAPGLEAARRFLPVATLARAGVLGWLVLASGTLPGGSAEACGERPLASVSIEITTLPVAAWCVSDAGEWTRRTELVPSAVATAVLVASVLAPLLVAGSHVGGAGGAWRVLDRRPRR